MIVWAGPAFAGAWTKELGETYAKAHADLYTTRSWVAPGGAEVGSYLGQQYGVYGEVGVLPGWRGQVTLALPLVVGTLTGEVEDPFGTQELRVSTVRTGDLRVGAQVALHPRLPLAVSVDAKLPTYTNGDVGAGHPGYQELFPKPGDGQVDLGAMALVGLSPWPGGFAELGVGVVHRTEWFVGWDTDLELADGVRLAAKAGHRVGRLLSILASEATLAPTPTPATRSFVAVSASAMVDLGRGVAVEPRLVADVWTRNTSQGLGCGLGVSYRR